MFRSLASAAILAASVLAAAPAHAATTICLVDAEKALNETAEGKAAQKRLESMYAAKQDELAKMQSDLEKAFQSFESSKMILSDDARRAKEEELVQKQRELQAKVMGAEQEMQQTYGNLLGGMEAKLYGVAETVGKTKGCTIVLQRAAALYVGPGAMDITTDIIAALDKQG